MQEELKDKDEKGAALVLALFLVMFFTALTFNMFYIAQSKHERAGVISLGQKSMSNIDTGQNVALYELRMAREYANGGAGPSDRQADNTYRAKPPTGTGITADQVQLDFIPTKTIATTVAISTVSQKHYIRTKDIYDYFTRVEITSDTALNYFASNDVSLSKAIDVTSTGACTLAETLLGTVEESTTSRVAKIWGTLCNGAVKSIGGYKLSQGNDLRSVVTSGTIRFNEDDNTTASLREEWNEIYQTTTAEIRNINYEKGIAIIPQSAMGRSNTGIGTKYYNIYYKENVTTEPISIGTLAGSTVYRTVTTVSPQEIKAVSVERKDLD